MFGRDIFVMVQYFINCYTSNYANFKGRARRKEFWSFTLFYYIACAAALVGDFTLGTATDDGEGGILYALFVLGSICPQLAVTVRRLHDVGRSGWFLLLSIVPLIGALLLLYWLLSSGDTSPNKWGANPKETPAVVQNLKY